MHLGERDLAGWTELCAWQRTTDWVRMYDVSVRADARHLIVDLPHEYAAPRDLLRRLRDVGE